MSTVTAFAFWTQSPNLLVITSTMFSQACVRYVHRVS